MPKTKSQPYTISVGGAEFRRWFHRDADALALAHRWLRFAWRRYAARMAADHPGSMADAIANQWDEQPLICTIYRDETDDAGVIRCKPATVVCRFDIAEVLGPAPLAP